MGDVADDCEQYRVDHRGAESQHDRAACPADEPRGCRDGGKSGRLEDHAESDEGFSAPSVGEPPGGELAETPDGGIERDEEGDLGDVQSCAGEEEREDAPGEPEVEIVHQSCLAGGGKGGLSPGRVGEDAGVRQTRLCRLHRRGFECDVVAGFPDEHGREDQREDRVAESEQERRGAQSVLFGEHPGQERGDRDCSVACGLVQSHGQSALTGADQVDLHHHCGRPGQALVDAEQNVGEDDPAPGRCPDDQQRHGKGEQPSGDEDGFAAEPIGERASEVVGSRLGDAERCDVGEYERVPGQVEGAFGQQGQDRLLLAHHPADQRVHGYEQDELRRVLAQPQTDRARCSHSSLTFGIVSLWPVGMTTEPNRSPMSPIPRMHTSQRLPGAACPHQDRDEQQRKDPAGE